MAKNPWEDCDQLRLPFYRPFDVAIRWCGLADRENAIAAGLAEPWHVQKGEWAVQYPCLAKHSEAVAYAMQCGQLPYGRDGSKVGTSEQVAKARRTVTHADLKDWFRTNFPEDVQKAHMTWLFDNVERSVHDAITIGTYQSVVAERDALKREVEALKGQAPRATQADSDARLKLLAGLVEASGLNIQLVTAAELCRRLEHTGYTVSPDTCERMLSAVRKRMPDWKE